MTAISSSWEVDKCILWYLKPYCYSVNGLIRVAWLETYNTKDPHWFLKISANLPTYPGSSTCTKELQLQKTARTFVSKLMRDALETGQLCRTLVKIWFKEMLLIFPQVLLNSHMLWGHPILWWFVPFSCLSSWYMILGREVILYISQTTVWLFLGGDSITCNGS